MKHAIAIAAIALIIYLLGAFVLWSLSWPATVDLADRFGVVAIFAIGVFIYAIAPRDT